MVDLGDLHGPLQPLLAHELRGAWAVLLHGVRDRKLESGGEVAFGVQHAQEPGAIGGVEDLEQPGRGFAGLGGDGLGGGRLDGNDLVGDRGRTAAFDAGIHGCGEPEGMRRNAVQLEADPADRLGDPDDAGGLLVADALARAGGSDKGYLLVAGELIVDQSQSGSRNGSGDAALRIDEATGQLAGGVGRGLQHEKLRLAEHRRTRQQLSLGDDRPIAVRQSGGAAEPGLQRRRDPHGSVAAIGFCDSTFHDRNGDDDLRLTGRTVAEELESPVDLQQPAARRDALRAALVAGAFLAGDLDARHLLVHPAEHAAPGTVLGHQRGEELVEVGVDLRVAEQFGEGRLVGVDAVGLVAGLDYDRDVGLGGELPSLDVLGVLSADIGLPALLEGGPGGVGHLGQLVARLAEPGEHHNAPGLAGLLERGLPVAEDGVALQHRVDGGRADLGGQPAEAGQDEVLDERLVRRIGDVR